MANVNLKLNAERAFGQFLPTVHLKRVAVGLNESDADVDRQSLLRVSAEMSVSFTKPENINYSGMPGDADYNGPSVEEFIKANFDDLYLYTCLSPFQKLNSDLEKENLHLKELFVAFNALDDINQENFTIDSPIWPIVKSELETLWEDKTYSYGMDSTTWMAMETGMDAGAAMIFGAIDKNADMIGAAVYGGYPLLPGSTAQHAALLGDYDSVGNLVNYVFYGDNLTGPWTKEQTVLSSELLSIVLRDADEATMAEFTSEEAIAFTDAFVADPVLAAAFDATKESENSFIYERLPNVLAEQGPNAPALRQFDKVKLTDLISEGNPYGSSLLFKKTYSSENEEIFSISNITLEFIYEPPEDSTAAMIETLIESLQSIYIISTIGLDMDERVSYDESEIDSIPLTIYNSFFGNITYEKVLSYNVVPNPYFEKFIFSDSKLTYDGIPVQGLNGKLYADEPYSREDIVRNYDKLIAKHTEISRSDKTLATHLKNLSIVLSKYSASPNLIKNLKKYQRTYTDKSQTTPSGRFYSEFNQNMVATNKRIMRQKQVEKRVVINATCIDIRPQRTIGDAYILPNPDTYILGPEAGAWVGWPVNIFNNSLHNSDYIPRKWAKIFRSLDYIDASSAYGESEAEQYKRWLVYRTIEEYKDVIGVSEEMIAAAVNEALAAEFGEGVDDLDDSGTSIEVDMIVKNQGYFFFDYEKALYTKCALAHIVDIPKLCVFFGTSVPYSSFKVKEVSMKRKEVDVVDVYAGSTMVTEGTSTPSSIPTHDVEMKTYFSMNHEVPVMYMTDHTVTDNDYRYGKPSVTFVDPTSNSPLDADDIRYSHIKFTHWDVTGTENTRGPYGSNTLAIFGTAPAALNYHEDGLSKPLVDSVGIGNTVAMLFKSYRCMAFEFEDYMDDDVGIRNTGASYDAGNAANDEMEAGYNAGGFYNDQYRNQLVQILHPRSEPQTFYEINLTVQDTSMQFFHMMNENFVKPLIEAWEEYFEYAEELCSYNESDESFNQFFIDAMIEKYITNRETTFGGAVSTSEIESYIVSGLSGAPTEMPIDPAFLNFKEYAKSIPPWVSGSFLSAIIKEVFFNNTPRVNLFSVLDNITFAMDQFDPAAGPADPSITKFVREMYSISPQKGNIESLRTFNERIRPLIEIFKYESPAMKNRLIDIFDLDASAASLTGEAFSELVLTPREINFPSYMDINTKIAVGEHRDAFYYDSLSAMKAIGPADVTPAPVTLMKSPQPTWMHPATFHRVAMVNPMAEKMKDLSSAARSYIQNNAGGYMPNKKLLHFIKSLPDYSRWQNRKTSSVTGTTPDVGDFPADFAMDDANHAYRIYFPKAWCNAQIIAENPTHRPYFQVIEGTGTFPPEPKKVEFWWYSVPEGDYDFDQASVEAATDY